VLDDRFAQFKLPEPSVVNIKLFEPPVILTLPTLPSRVIALTVKLLAVINVLPSSNVNAGLPPNMPSSLYCTCVFAPPAATLLMLLPLPQRRLPDPSVVNMKLFEPPVIVTFPTLPKLAVLVATILFAVNTVVVLSKVKPDTAPKLLLSLNRI